MKSISHPWFHDTVSALAYSIAADSPEALPPFNDVTRFILEQHARMPDYLRAPMVAATMGFDTAGLVRGKFFHQQDPSSRRRQIAAWKHAGGSFQRDLVRYFESLAAFALHSRQRPVAQAVELSGKNVIDDPRGVPRAEIVVIGSGPGGAITACLLAEHGHDVLLVEDGPFLPLQSCEPFSRDEMTQKYRNGGQTVALGKNKISYVEGRCVGGGSEINSALYHRTPPEILERWRKEFRVDGLSEIDLRPHFEACERDVSVSPLPCPAPAASLKLHEGAVRLGWKSVEVPRWFRYDDQSPAGRRQSMTETFIPRFLRAGGKILPHTRVEHLRQDGTRWVLSARHHGTNRIRIAAETVFLCAGAVQSPLILRRSGITANVGDSLQVHPTVKMIARFPETVNAADMGVPVHQVKEFSPRLGFGCSISGLPHLALGMLDHPHTASLPDEWQRMAIYYAMITSEGAGTVRPIPGARDPLVRYALTDNDRSNLADGFQKLGRILFEAGATELYPVLAGGVPLRGNDDLGRLPQIIADGTANLMTIHLFSSCPMGENRERCAADSFGRVYGFNNLFLNDASLLCSAPGVNPQGSIMAIARR
ncbi:MAG TPA: GMC family oxidoreductase, partial [Desulfuromonadaceae bacterium]|nr:GMC family oxidoreductase [Desulfuromonadaceae bacterium]